MIRFKTYLPHLLALIALGALTTGCSAHFDTSSSAQTACIETMESRLHEIDQAEDLRALETDSEQSAVRPGNETVVLKGDPARIVFLLHGFIGSPYEVNPLGEALNAAGFTVVMPLMAGFGRSTNVALGVTPEVWMNTTKAQLEAAQACQPKIQVVGFSLGALLETKLILENPEIAAKTASLTLLSPALVIRINSIMNLGSIILNTVNPSPLISTLATAARAGGNHDLDIPEQNPEHYNVEMPIRTSNALSALASSVDYTLFDQIHFPVKVIYSDLDHTIDGATGLSLIAEHDASVSSFVLTAEQNSAHQILLSTEPGVVSSVIENVRSNFAE